MVRGRSGFSLIELVVALGVAGFTVLITSQVVVQMHTVQQRTVASANGDNDSLGGLAIANNLPAISQMIEVLADDPEKYPQLANCLQNLGSNCQQKYSNQPLTLKTVLKRNSQGVEVPDTLLTDTPTCSSTGCTMHKITVQTGLVPQADGVNRSTSRNVQIPNFLLSKNGQIVGAVNYACALPPLNGNLLQIDFSSGTGVAICADLTGNSYTCNDNVSPLLGFGGTGAAGCRLPSSLDAQCGSGGIQQYSLGGNITNYCGKQHETDSSAGLGSPPVSIPTTALGAMAPTIVTTFGTNGIYTATPMNCPLISKSSTSQLTICLGRTLQDYLNANDCVANSGGICPFASGTTAMAGSISFSCRCISGSTFSQYCPSSGRPYFGPEISVGPNFSATPNTWYMDYPDQQANCSGSQ